MDHGSLAELGDEPVGVDLGRRHVEAHPDVVLVGERPGRLPQRIRARRVADQGRPRAEASVGDAAMAHQLVLEPGDRCVGVLAVHVGFGRQVPDPRPEPTADADLGEPVDHLVEEADRAGLEERRGAAAQHLRGGELRGAPLVPLLVGGVELRQPHEHVLLERRVVGDVPAGQRLAGDVDVGVHHPGRQDEPVAADPRSAVYRCSRSAVLPTSTMSPRSTATDPRWMMSRVAFIVTTYQASIRRSTRVGVGRRTGGVGVGHGVGLSVMPPRVATNASWNPIGSMRRIASKPASRSIDATSP